MGVEMRRLPAAAWVVPASIGLYASVLLAHWAGGSEGPAPRWAATQRARAWSSVPAIASDDGAAPMVRARVADVVVDPLAESAAVLLAGIDTQRLVSLTLQRAAAEALRARWIDGRSTAVTAAGERPSDGPLAVTMLEALGGRVESVRLRAGTGEGAPLQTIVQVETPGGDSIRLETCLADGLALALRWDTPVEVDPKTWETRGFGQADVPPASDRAIPSPNRPAQKL